MPLQPQFELRQDDEFIYVRVKVPFVKISEAELSIDGPDLQFFCKPYLLKLTFPGRLVDDERARAVYDISDSHGTIEVYAPKETRGEEFADLDLLTRLLQPRQRPIGAASAAARPTDGSDTALREEDDIERLASLSLAEASLPRSRATPSTRPLIEVLSSVDFGESAAEEGASVDAVTRAAPPVVSGAAPPLTPAAPPTLGSGPTEDTSRPAERPAPPAALPPILPTPPHYGFNRQFSGLFRTLRAELPGVVDLPDPDDTPPLERRRLREAAEAEAFDPERFAADLEDGVADPVFVEAVTLQTWWGPTGTAGGGQWQWTAEEAAELASLGNRELLIDGHAVGGAAARGGGAAPSPPAPLVELRPDADGMLYSSEGGDEAEGGREGGGDATGTAQVAAEAPSESDAAPPSSEETASVREAGGAAAAGAEDAEVDPSVEPETLRLLLGLPSLLAAYAHDHRATGGDPTCESGWAVATLCPLLSWLDDSTLAEEEGAGTAAAAALIPLEAAQAPGVLQIVARPAGGEQAAAPPPSRAAPSAAAAASPPTLDAELRACARTFLRRALAFPYLRRWDLGLLALADAAGILLLGRRAVLRALLAVRRLLAGEEARYLLNRLVLDDYCRWVQAAAAAAVGGSGGGRRRAAGAVTDATLAWLGGRLSLAVGALAAEAQLRGPAAAPACVGLDASVGASDDGSSSDSSDSEEAGSESGDEPA